MEKSKIQGVIAGVIIWYVWKDRTIFVPINVVQHLIEIGQKSIPWDCDNPSVIEIDGEKQRIYYKYDMTSFFDKAVPLFDIGV